MTLISFVVALVLLAHTAVVGIRIGMRMAMNSGQQSPFPQQPQPNQPRTFVSYNVYKGKAAMAIKPVSPVFTQMSNGNRLLSKDGGILIEAAPVSGVREYDWTKKSAFLLDPTECGQILYFHETKGNEVNFIHDTFMGGMSLSICFSLFLSRSLLMQW